LQEQRAPQDVEPTNRDAAVRSDRSCATEG